MLRVGSRGRLWRVPESSAFWRRSRRQVPESFGACWFRFRRQVPARAGVGSGGRVRKVLESSGAATLTGAAM